jgi:tRNA (guanine-N7-)-methyltransferase
MGRRSLPRVDSSLDVSQYLLTAANMPPVLTAAAVFGRSLPLELEIGSGKGMFLLNAARAHPLHGFLGLEISHKYAQFAASRLARDGVDNARLIRADAVEFIPQFVPDQSLWAVHVYFPDPWWKKRHRRRRVMNEALIDQLVRVLKPGGRLHFWTDVADYFESTLQLIAGRDSLAGPFEVPEQPALHDLDYRTHFERRVRQNRLPVYRAEFSKPAWRSECRTDDVP